TRMAGRDGGDRRCSHGRAGGRLDRRRDARAHGGGSRRDRRGNRADGRGDGPDAPGGEPRGREALRRASPRSGYISAARARPRLAPGDSELRKWPPHAMAGSWNAEIVPGLAPEPGDIVLGKQTYSPFLNPAFERTLAERGLTRLYITGLHTDCCARHTSGDAFQR